MWAPLTCIAKRSGLSLINRSDLVENFASQAVIAIENARLLNELRQRTDDLSEALRSADRYLRGAEVISRSKFDLEPILRSVVDTAARLCRAEQGGIFRVDQAHRPVCGGP